MLLGHNWACPAVLTPPGLQEARNYAGAYREWLRLLPEAGEKVGSAPELLQEGGRKAL